MQTRIIIAAFQTASGKWTADDSLSKIVIRKNINRAESEMQSGGEGFPFSP